MTEQKTEQKQQERQMSETIKSFKGFDSNWKCRDFQYEVGKTYTHGGPVEACGSGFHACEHPLGVFAYYPPAGSKFASVEQSGDLSRHGDDSKVASRRITIKAELSIAGLVSAAIEYVTSRCEPINPESPASATGYLGAASATGDLGAASATGDQGAASATGYQGAASATGNRGAASAAGDRGAASATGQKSVALAAGYEGRALGVNGGAIFLVRRDANDNITQVFASKVGENGIEPHVWYTLGEDGNPVEVARTQEAA